MPTPYEYSVFSKFVYHNSNIQLPSTNWKIFKTSDWFNLDGYKGEAYRNIQTNEVVVAHKGTNDILDLVLNDAPLAAWDSVTLQYTGSAKTFVQQVKSQMTLLSIPHNKLSYTGHSLGGALAQMCSAADSLLGLLNNNAVVFDSPGVTLQMLQNAVGASFSNPASLTLTNYVAAPHVVNTANTHFANLIRIYPVYNPSAIPELLALSVPTYTFGYSLQQHDMLAITNLFNPLTGQAMVQSSPASWPAGGYAGYSNYFLSYDINPEYWDLYCARKGSNAQQKSNFINTYLGGRHSLSSAGVTINGDASDNNIWGATNGADVLNGYSGNDILNGHGGDDTLNGGVGIDTYVFDTSNFGQVQIIDSDGLGRLKFDDTNISGTFKEATNNPGIYFAIRQGNTYALQKINNNVDLQLTVNNLNPAISNVIIKSFINGNLGLNLVDAPVVQYTFGPEIVIDTNPDINAGQNNGIAYGFVKLSALINSKFVAIWITNHVVTTGGTTALTLNGQIFNADGSAAANKFNIDTSIAGLASVDRSSITSIENGKFAVAWTHAYFPEPSRPVNQAMIQIFNADGSPHTNKIILDHDGSPDTDSGQPTLCYLGNNKVLVTFYSANAVEKFAVLFDSDGNVMVPTFNMNIVPSSATTIPINAFIENNKFVSVWLNYISPPDYIDVRAQFYDFHINKIDSEFTVNLPVYRNGILFGHSLYPPAIINFSNGNFIIAWTSDGAWQDNPTTYGIRAQRFDRNAVRVGAEFIIPAASTASTPVINPSIDSLDSGGYIVTWTQQRFVPISPYFMDYDIYGQIFDTNDNNVGTSFLVNSIIAGYQGASSVSVLQNANIVVGWETCMASAPCGDSATSVSIRILSTNRIANALGDIGQPLVGTNNADVLNSPTGSNAITGNGGADIYVISQVANARASITDFEPSIQKIDLTAHRSINGINDLIITPGSAVINLPSNQTIHVDNIEGTLIPQNITADNFIFAPVNRAPIASCALVSASPQINTQITVNPVACVVDPDGDTLSWYLDNNLNDTHFFNTTDYATWIQQDPYNGLVTIIVPNARSYFGTLIAMDPYGLSVELPFNITGVNITDTSAAPIVSSSADEHAVFSSSGLSSTDSSSADAANGLSFSSTADSASATSGSSAGTASTASSMPPQTSGASRPTSILGTAISAIFSADFFAQQFSNSLMLGSYFISQLYKNQTDKADQLRPCNSVDQAQLKKTQALIFLQKDTFAGLKNSLAEQSNLFVDQFVYIKSKLEWLEYSVADAQSSNKVSDNLLKEIVRVTERADDVLLHLSQMNQELKKIACEQRPVDIHYDVVKKQIIVKPSATLFVKTDKRDDKQLKYQQINNHAQFWARPARSENNLINSRAPNFPVEPTRLNF